MPASGTRLFMPQGDKIGYPSGVGLSLKVCVVLLGVLDQVKYMIQNNFAIFFPFKQVVFHIGSVKLLAGT